MNTPEPRTPGVSLRRLGAAAFVLGLVQGLGGIVRDCALTCHVGYRFAPLAFLVVAVLSLPFVALQLRMQRRLGPEKWRVRATFFVAASLVVFRLVLALLRPGDGSPLHLSSRATYLVFFVWVDVAFMIIGAQLFGLLEGDESATDRGLTVFAGATYGGGLLGGVLATGANGWLQGHLHLPFDVARDHLMLPMALVLISLVPIARGKAAAGSTHDAPLAATPASAISGHIGPTPAVTAAAEGANPPGGLGLALRLLTGDADARAVTTSFVFASAAAIGLEALFFWILTAQTNGDSGYVRLLATMALWINGASLLLAAGGASRIIRRLGLAVTVMLVPASLFVGTGYLLVATMLTVMLTIRVVKDSLSGGLYEPASERLLVRLQGDHYPQQRPVFDVASRAGTGLGALLVLILTLVFHAPVRVLVGVVVALHLAWFATLVPLVRRARALRKVSA
jgi:AAA family ATP:ADP antiporter